MKRVLISLGLCFAAMGSAQVKYSVEMGGKMVGTASMTQRVSDDGSKSVDLKMELTVSSQKLSIRSQNSYDSKGRPIRKFMDANIPGGTLQRQLIATFDGKGASIVQLDGGKRTTRQIPLVETAPRADASEFWFIRDTPKVGESVKTYSFNMDILAWQLQTVAYRGRRSIKVNGKTVEAHVIETIGDRPAKAFVDDRGIPWIVESGSTVLRRIQE